MNQPAIWFCRGQISLWRQGTAEPQNTQGVWCNWAHRSVCPTEGDSERRWHLQDGNHRGLWSTSGVYAPSASHFAFSHWSYNFALCPCLVPLPCAFAFAVIHCLQQAWLRLKPCPDCTRSFGKHEALAITACEDIHVHGLLQGTEEVTPAAMFFSYLLLLCNVGHYRVWWQPNGCCSAYHQLNGSTSDNHVIRFYLYPLWCNVGHYRVWRQSSGWCTASHRKDGGSPDSRHRFKWCSICAKDVGKHCEWHHLCWYQGTNNR